MKKFQHILVETQDGTTLVTLNRPEIHNAFNEVMIAELAEVFAQLNSDSNTRVVLLNGAGSSFCAGADLHWMKKMASYSDQENRDDAKTLHQMLNAVARCSKPVIAHVHGPAVGGGVGLVAAVDMAFAHEEVKFGFSEVKLGLIPAVISPFVMAKIGQANAREFFLTGERFSAAVARDMGLVQGVGTSEEIKMVIGQKIKHLKSAGPEAVAACKQLIDEVGEAPWDQVGEVTSRKIAERRASTEGQEGMNAFLEKRKPKWIK